jgi:hypothetical protein
MSLRIKNIISAQTQSHLLWCLAVLAVFLVLTPAALAAEDFTWSGAAAIGEDGWSKSANWTGLNPPFGKIGTLTFPVLTSPTCTAEPPTATCYASENDLTDLEVNDLEVDDGAPYTIRGNAITLGEGGLNATTSSHDNGQNSAFIQNMPITLAAPQTWTIIGGSGFQSLDLDHVSVSGTSSFAIDPLDFGFLSLDDGTTFEVGETTIKGSGQVFVGPPGQPAVLNAADGDKVTVEAGTTLTASDASTGPLDVTGGTLEVGQYSVAGHLAVVGGVTLGPASMYRTSMNGPDTVAGTDYSQMTATGNVDLAEATLSLEDGATTFEGEGGSCIELTPGDVDTLITTSGALSGTYKGVPNEATISLHCGATGIAPTAKINYTAHQVTATVETAGSSKTASKEEIEKEETATEKMVQAPIAEGGITEGRSTGTSTTKSEPTPAPILGQSETASPISGVVTVRLKGTSKFIPLSGASTIPDGSEVEATNGHVLITVATLIPGKTQTAEVWGGRFLIDQEHAGSGETHFIPSLPLAGCPRVELPRGSAAAVAAGAKHSSGPKSRHLWVSEGGGSWGTNGRYVSTTVEGTHWLTLDECNRSEVQVVAGKVQVHDLIHNKTKVLTAGQSYIAARGPSKKPR